MSRFRTAISFAIGGAAIKAGGITAFNAFHPGWLRSTAAPGEGADTGYEILIAFGAAIQGFIVGGLPYDGALRG